jgi:hypothetical protein
MRERSLELSSERQQSTLGAIPESTRLHATRIHEDIFDRNIDVQILRLRRKLEPDSSAPPIFRLNAASAMCSLFRSRTAENLTRYDCNTFSHC